MAESDKTTKQQPSSSAAGKTAYSTFPVVTPHVPRDPRTYHGKPEDWQRVAPKRTFGGKVSLPIANGCDVLQDADLRQTLASQGCCSRGRPAGR